MLAACRQSWGLPHVMGPCGSGCWHCAWVCTALYSGFASTGLEGRSCAGFSHHMLILGSVWLCQAKFWRQLLLELCSSKVSSELSPGQAGHAVVLVVLWLLGVTGDSYHVTLSFMKLFILIMPELAHIRQVLCAARGTSGEKPMCFSAGRKLSTSLKVLIQLECSQAMLLGAPT